MDTTQSAPILISNKPIKPEYKHLEKIEINSDEFTLGRSLHNSVVLPYIQISRNHCKIIKNCDGEWSIEDHSSFGIKINNDKLGKGSKRKLSHLDVIYLDGLDDFVYKFVLPGNDDGVFEIPRKRMKMDNNCIDNNIINSMKIKFEASQSNEIKHIEEKIHNAKQMQTNSMMLKEQLKQDMDRKIQKLECDFALQIESLKGEKNEVERQKALLIEERDAQLANVKTEMEGKIYELMDQIQKHNETESELMKENNQLREKLLKEREEFLTELNRESTSKQDMLEKLEAKIKEQEEVRLKEKMEFEDVLKRETEQMRLAKEKELKELEELKQQREIELQRELDKIKKNLEEQVVQTEQQRMMAELKLNQQMQEMKKLNDEEKTKMEQLLKEREEIQNKLNEAQINAEKSLEELRKRVSERETELAALAAERIQKQAEQSGEVISTLQEQLEKAKTQLQFVETEKNTLLESLCTDTAETSTKQSTLTQVGELMESELQCSICAELFVEATTLNCSHTFCKYCITMWKKKKRDCPICRATILSECRSLVLDTFIEKMVQNLTEEMKVKRQDILKYRAELVEEMTRQTATGSSRGGVSYDESEISDYNELEEEEEYDEDYSEGDYFGYEEYDEFSGSVESDEWYDTDGGPDGPARAAPLRARPAATHAGRNPSVGGRSRSYIPGVPGSSYGGYGRCYNCGARGHWAPGCPYR